MKVLSFGEVLFDIIENEPHLGGAPLNFAAHFVKCGGDAAIMSRLGKDVLGERAEAEIKQLGVDIKHLQWDGEHATGTVEVTLENGQPEYNIINSVAYDFIEYPSEQVLPEFDVLYFGSLIQRSEVSTLALHSLVATNTFKHIFFDVNLRKDGYNKEIIARSLLMCNILKLNDAEVMVLADLLYDRPMSMQHFCSRLTSEYDIKLVLITAGGKGSYYYAEGALVFVSGNKVEVADTIGAGDAFSAGFVFKYLLTNDPKSASKMANKVGAYVASRTGAIPEYDDSIKELLVESKA